MGKRDRKRRPARRKAFREAKPVILVVCEGKVTEPEYLHGFFKACQNPRVRIEVHGGQGVPRSIVAYARDRKKQREKQSRRENDDNLRYDQVWCVIDVDEHPNLNDAKQMARDNDLLLAVSNPCIELWLWLHFAEQPGMQHGQDLQRMLTQHVPDYDKHVEYTPFQAGYDNAVRRAERLDDDHNPSTGMWRLTESIRQDA
jgi:hypothetical protein